MLNKIIDFLMPQNDIFLYIFLFLSAIIENLFPPIPGDTITAFGAFLVGQGRLSYPLVLLVTTAGSIIGFMLLFLIARALERKFFLERDYKFFSKDSILKGELWFKKYGYGVILANRFLPGVRSVISIVSGISQLNFGRVLIFASISAAVWNFIWLHTGYMLGSNWNVVKERLGDLVARYNIIMAIIFSVFFIAFIIYKIVKKIKSKKSV